MAILCHFSCGSSGPPEIKDKIEMKLRPYSGEVGKMSRLRISAKKITTALLKFP